MSDRFEPGVLEPRRLNLGCRVLLGLVGVVTLSLTVVSVWFLEAERLWGIELRAVIRRLNEAHLADAEVRENDATALRALVLRQGSYERLERLAVGADAVDRDLARFAIASSDELSRRFGERHQDDLDGWSRLQANLALHHRPAPAPIAPLPASRIAALALAASAFDRHFDTKDLDCEPTHAFVLDVDGSGEERIILWNEFRGAHHKSEQAFILDRVGKSVVQKLLASDGSIRWVLWDGAPAVLVSEIFAEGCGCEGSVLEGAVTVRHQLLRWNGGHFARGDSVYTPFHGENDKYP